MLQPQLRRSRGKGYIRVLKFSRSLEVLSLEQHLNGEHYPDCDHHISSVFAAVTLVSSEVQIMAQDSAPHTQNNEWTGPGVPQ